MKQIPSFFQLSEEKISQLEALIPLYQYWNERINVVSRKDIHLLEERHILHSLAIAKVVSFPDNAKVLDIGTGGGFPGIPLAIFFPNTQFVLLDSIAKKIHVVEEIVKGLKLENVTVKRMRAEEFTEKVDFVVSRAVANMETLIQWTQKNIRNTSIHPTIPNGFFFLKGGDLTAEIKKHKKGCTQNDISSFYPLPFFEDKKIIYLPKVNKL